MKQKHEFINHNLVKILEIKNEFKNRIKKELENFPDKILAIANDRDSVFFIGVHERNIKDYVINKDLFNIDYDNGTKKTLVLNDIYRMMLNEFYYIVDWEKGTKEIELQTQVCILEIINRITSEKEIMNSNISLITLVSNENILKMHHKNSALSSQI
ncbi:hypothetical protein DP067_00820 [Mycoplasmopsis anatis]|uniref:Uncharacterized protein n=1 Tax=Mycoplasmopsis anatis 1340 TaxID=1034808 RepID=F9QDQ9_9BACT|nr:hypothetical protein [Mycoplasmopsis anatis]AWX69919.1 hypothetical protein DP067_00820 [Mycoplasmopsis anatis]EGS29086.1 hypothetical protein GIG_02663 [Mycoplasmopsis anatis 1340]MBW0599317.1 hypothetical protein [Mycoplasmopsis anatis]MBW0603239.1 hypothetical protein [Mycoplasmopsis anatis]VEU73658.1 Uncharacterised protein [Mycoplasmopsis anatis]